MKKLIAVICVLAMAISASGTVYAATEPAVIEVGANDFVKDLYVSQEVEIAKGINMQIPDSFEVEEKDGIITATDGRHIVEITTTPADKNEFKSLAEAKKAFIDKGLQKSLVEMKINGISALSVVTEDGTYMVLIMTEDGEMITIKYPDFNTADEEYKAWIKNMIVSIGLK